MKTTIRSSGPGRRLAAGACALCLLFAAGCSALSTVGTPPPPGYYALGLAPQAGPLAPAPLAASGPILMISSPRAAAGFDSQHIIYVRKPHSLEYFAHNEWIDTPARMLAPLLVAAIGRGGGFRAVVGMPSSAAGDLRLDTEILALQHEFTASPSQVRFALRADLVADATRSVLASRVFEAVETAPADDPYGGVIAANRAVTRVLEELSAFCVATAQAQSQRRPTGPARDR